VWPPPLSEELHVFEPAPDPLEVVVGCCPGSPTRIWTGTVVVVEDPHLVPVPDPPLACWPLWVLEEPARLACWFCEEPEFGAEVPVLAGTLDVEPPVGVVAGKVEFAGPDEPPEVVPGDDAGDEMAWAVE